MEYKLYNSNTLKSVQLNEDTTLIFELNKTNKDKMFLNTLLYSSQYGCPISFSLIQNLNSTTNIGFGAGVILDFMYEITSVSNTSITLKHPTGDIEEFINSYIKTVDTGKNIVYYYSTTTSNFIKRIENGNISNLTYHNGSFVGLFEYRGITPLALSKFTRNNNTDKGWISVTYGVNGKLQYLFNEAEEQEFVEFTYSSNYTQFVASKKFDKSTKTEINKVTFTYANGTLSSIIETLHAKSTPIRHTSFSKTTNSIVVKNEISTLSSSVTLSNNAVSSIQMQDDTMSITYVDDYQTNINLNGMWEKYFFDHNYNLQHIENSVGRSKSFHYDNTLRRLLLSESNTIFTKSKKNNSKILDRDDIEIISNNSYSYNRDASHSGFPAGYFPIRMEMCEIEEDQNENFSFRFSKNGIATNVESIILWYRIVSTTSTPAYGDINAYLYFYKNESDKDVVIKSEEVTLNTTINKKWLFNVLSAKVAEDYDTVEVHFSVNNPIYKIDICVELIEDSLAKIYKYDSFGRPIKVLTGSKINQYQYNEDNLLVSSSNCLSSYDEYGKPIIIINSNSIQQEITRDEYSNETSKKVYNYDKSKYLQSSKSYIDCEHLTSENTTNNDNITYLYDDKKRMNGVTSSNSTTNVTYISNDDVNYGKLQKIIHNYENIIDSVRLEGSQIIYGNKGLVTNIRHLNTSLLPNYTYSYTYDTQNRLTKITLGNITIVEYTYAFVNNKKTITMKLNGKSISYNYDENERLISKSNSSGEMFVYSYDDETRRITSINNVSNNETISFEYDGQLLLKVLSGTFNVEYAYNNNKNRIIEKKYKDNTLISIEKYTDSSLRSRKNNLMTFENMVMQNEGDDVYLTTFTKRVYKDVLFNTIYEKNITKELRGKLYNQIVKNIELTPVNNNYCYDSMPCISFSNGDTPLLYQFNGEYCFENKYSVFFGFKLDSLNKNKPILELSNYNNNAYDKIRLFVEEKKLVISLYKYSSSESISTDFEVSNTVNKMNFIALNITCTKTSSTSFVYTIEVYYNGKSVGKVENITLGNDMNSLYLMGDSATNVNTGKITTLFVKRNSHITSNRIAQYSSMLIDIYYGNKLCKNNFNKKVRLLNKDIRMICFDDTFNPIDEHTTLLSFNGGKNLLSMSDYFCSDSETGENILALRSQKLAYYFNLYKLGIVGVRFKRIDGIKTNIFSINFDELSINVKTDELGYLKVDLNYNNIYSSPIKINTSWNNIFIKFEQTLTSSSIEEFIYKVYLCINENIYYLDELYFTKSTSDAIVSVGESYLQASDVFGCFGFVEKVIGCSTSYTISYLNSLLNNFGEGVLNEYDEFNQKTKKHIYTSSSHKVTHSYIFDISSAGRLMGKLANESVSLGGHTLTYYYTYNIDKTISKQRVHSSVTNTYSDKTFTYDNKKQLIQYSDGTNSYLYTYDNMGNITNITKNGTTIHTATYNNGILINEVNGYIINYDVSGYPTTKKLGSTTIENYSWVDGKLHEIEYVSSGVKICFEYAGNGFRTSKKEYHNDTLYNTTNYYYNADGLLVYETRTLNDVKLEYLYDAEGSLYGVYYNGTPYYYIKDALGNITHLVDSSTNIVTRFDYEGAYGLHNVIDVNSVGSNHISFINPFRYKGYYYDVETGLAMVGQRYYSPELCRFIQPADVSSLNPRSINGLNLYAYANNNPVGIAYSGSSAAFGATGGMVSSLALGGLTSVGGHLSGSAGLSIKFPSQNWVSLGMDLTASMAGAFSVLKWTMNNPEFYEFWYSAWGLSEHQVLSNLKSPMTKIASAVSYGLVAYDTYTDVAGHIKAGDSWQKTTASGMVTAGVGAFNVWASAKVGAAIGGYIGGVPGFLIGTAAGVVVGIVINGIFYTEINGKSIAGHIEDGIEWFLEWIS